MILPFPSRKNPVAPLVVALALHSEEAANEHDLEWAHWLFQGVRARCVAVVFQSDAMDRAELLSDWQTFAAESFLPILAPALIEGWQQAIIGDESGLLAWNLKLNQQLNETSRERSLAAGEVLLHDTRGAKYQGALGKLRQRIETGETDGHLAMVWAGLSAMFQIPPVDMLTEYLRQEWLVGTRDFASAGEPQGALSFPGLAQQALHHSRVLAFDEPLPKAAGG